MGLQMYNIFLCEQTFLLQKTIFDISLPSELARMAELVDALVSGTSDRKIVQVRVLFWAQERLCRLLFLKHHTKSFFFLCESAASGWTLRLNNWHCEHYLITCTKFGLLSYLQSYAQTLHSCINSMCFHIPVRLHPRYHWRPPGRIFWDSAVAGTPCNQQCRRPGLFCTRLPIGRQADPKLLILLGLFCHGFPLGGIPAF